MCSEFDADSGALTLAEELPLQNLSELRLWRDTQNLIWYLTQALGIEAESWEPARLREVTEVMLSLYPNVTRVVDMMSDRVWESSDTADLVHHISLNTYAPLP